MSEMAVLEGLQVGTLLDSSSRPPSQQLLSGAALP